MKKFDNINSMSMVMTADFEGSLNIYPLFRLLQINRQKNFVKNSYIDYTPLISEVNNNSIVEYNGENLPFYGYAGPIMYMSHGLHVRTNYAKDTGIFKNCIMMYMSVSNKNINFKLSDKSMHICGLKNKEMGLETFNVLKYNIDSIQNFLNYMNDNIEYAHNTVEYIKKNCKGNMVYVIEDSNYIMDPNDVYLLDGSFTIKPQSNTFYQLLKIKDKLSGVLREKIDNIETYHMGCMNNNMFPIHCNLVYSLKLPSVILPNNCDQIIYDFMIDKISDFTVYESYCVNLDWMLTIKSLYNESDLSLKNLKYNNINYTYNIGALNRSEFRNYVNKFPPFVAAYMKSVDTFVTVYLQFEIPEHLSDEIKRNKKNNKNAHKFIVYKTGGITQSGPHPELNKDAYEKFIEMINYDKTKYIKS